MTFGKTGSRNLMHYSLTVHSYVQDGLIAMWDGIENVGYGTHDMNAAFWKNLCGDSRYDFTVNDGASWSADALITNHDFKTPAAICSSTIPYKQIVTMECVFNILEVNPDIVTNRSRYHFFKVGTNEAAHWSSTTFLTMRCINWNVTNSQYGWQPMTNHVNIYSMSSTLPPIGFRSISVVYNVTSGLDQNVDPKAFCINGNAMPVRWGPEGDANSKDFMVVGASTNAVLDGFYGYAYAIRLYSRALTSSEIAMNYAIDKCRFNLTGGGKSLNV